MLYLFLEDVVYIIFGEIWAEFKKKNQKLLILPEKLVCYNETQRTARTGIIRCTESLL